MAMIRIMVLDIQKPNPLGVMQGIQPTPVMELTKIPSLPDTLCPGDHYLGRSDRVNLKQFVFEEYILAAVFAAVAFLSLVFAGYMTTAYNAEKLSQAYYGSNTVYLQVNDPDNQLDYEAVYAGMKDAVLFRELSGNRVRGILLRGKIVPPPLLTGRFFSEADFFTGKRLVVVGNTYNPVITEVNGRDCIKINQEDYEVIGRMGASEISQLDNMLLVNLDAVDLGKSGLYAIDGQSEQNIVSASLLFKSEVERAGAGYKLIEREPTGIRRLLKYEQSNALLYLVLVSVLLLSSVAVNLSLYEKKKSEIAVQRLIGFSSAKIVGQLLKHYALLAHIGYSGGLLAGLLLICTGIISISDPLAAAASYPASMLFGLLLITVPAVQALHSQARELLNE